VEYAVAASRQARSVLAWEEAARVLSLALDGAREPLTAARRCELLIELGDALMFAGKAVPALLACLAATLVWTRDRQTAAGRGRRDQLSAEALALACGLRDARLLAGAMGAPWAHGSARATRPGSA
jgi:hypothetical protein